MNFVLKTSHSVFKTKNSVFVSAEFVRCRSATPTTTRHAAPTYTTTTRRPQATLMVTARAPPPGVTLAPCLSVNISSTLGTPMLQRLEEIPNPLPPDSHHNVILGCVSDCEFALWFIIFNPKSIIFNPKSLIFNPQSSSRLTQNSSFLIQNS